MYFTVEFLSLQTKSLLLRLDTGARITRQTLRVMETEPYVTVCCMYAKKRIVKWLWP